MPTNIKPTTKDLGEFSVSRVLPNMAKRMVGPFVFFDHMGPAKFAPGQGVNVRPHPHIGLATLTYLLRGNILHRDSLGNCQEIQPGDVNWMVAGKGITHSERETIEVNASDHELDGIQCWIALPKEHAECEPSFIHVDKLDLPHHIYQGQTVRIVAGSAYDLISPIKTYSPMFLVDINAQAGETIEHPNPDHECLVYLAHGELDISGKTLRAGDTFLLEDDDEILTTAYSRLVLLGGKAWAQAPHLVWNFVSFDSARITQAQEDWRAGRFPEVVGDNEECIPLPD
jgi:redox-sensitive bicupin YhaK (pirin superfamily)